jgi:hypothetical protein
MYSFYNDNPLISVLDLSLREDFKVVQIFENHTHQKTKEDTPFLKRVFIGYKGRSLIKSYTEIIYILKYLKLFSSKHLVSNEPNDFFELHQNDNGKNVRLQCKFDTERFIYRAEADTIYDILNSAIQGYSKKYFNRGRNSADELVYLETILQESVFENKREH